MPALISVLHFVLEWFSTMKLNSETSAWKPCPRDKAYIQPPVFHICLPWLIISPENFLACQFITSHEHMVDNPVQSLKNRSHDSAIPHAVYASQLCRSVCPKFLFKLCHQDCFTTLVLRSFVLLKGLGSPCGHTCRPSLKWEEKVSHLLLPTFCSLCKSPRNFQEDRR